MSLPPRQPRPIPAGGRPYPRYLGPTDPVPSLHDRALQALADAEESVRDMKLGRLRQPGGWAYVPVIGPAWEAAADLQDGNYAGAAFNGAMFLADISPIAPAARAIKIVRAINATARAPLLARAATQTARIRKIENAARKAKGVTGKYEVHHTMPMAGWGPIAKADRKAEGLLRNHPAMLKPLDKEAHRRLTGSFTRPDGTVQPQFGPAKKAWHGTNALQKGTVAAAAGAFADWGENIARPPAAPDRSQSKR